MSQSNESIFKKVYTLLLTHSTLVFFIVMLVAAAFLSDRFYTVNNITNVLRQSVPLGIVALGLLFVILTGGIDLSVGSIMALVSVAVALWIPDYGIFGSSLFAIALGAFIGAGAGILIAYFKVAPFVATLAMMTIARGISLIISKGQPVFIDNVAFTDFGTANLLNIPTLFWVLLLILAFALFIYKKTAFGRLVISLGSNEVATQFAGIRVERYKFAVYVISGIACAVAGILATTRTGVGSPVFGIGFELDAIAAVVIGGASLSGGRGTVINTLIGVLILSIISNVMNLMNIPGYHQQVVKGGIIILAVLLESLKNKQQLSR
ncbi:ABC transporter permease [Conservatibacter flavescens]|uniref:ABC transporter permease n=1 Tax=Conservatibacter flavescens TaxID=28161 RepID=A0A2M8S303_9PAST|nr:ABC transporter permease [Conservatibacter flavescens]PJG85487.1 ABC transporter permease [Conservatibacter flavescens]